MSDCNTMYKISVPIIGQSALHIANVSNPTNGRVCSKSRVEISKFIN